MTGTEGEQDVARGEGRAPAGLDSTAALLRVETAHLDATVHALVARLSSVPGLQMTVRYRHGRLRRLLGDLPYINDLHRAGDPIESIAVSVRDSHYTLTSTNGALRCTRARSAGGAGEEELTFSAWADALFDDITHENLINHDAMLALRELVERDSLA